MSLEQIEKEEEYEVGSPMMFVHKPWSCMSSCEPCAPSDGNIDLYEHYTEAGKTALLIGERLLIDEAP